VLVVALVVILIAVIGTRKKGQSATQKKSGAGPGPGGPISAVVGTVMEKEVPIYLDGLGTVQAFNMVTVRSRVDGQLQKLLFQEGQDVHAGDVLAQIDPDPLRTQVQQAEAKKAQDESQLAFAKVQ